MLSSVKVNTRKQPSSSKRVRLQASACLSRVSSFQSLPRDMPRFWRKRLEIVCHSYHAPLRKSWVAELSTLVLNIPFSDIFKDLSLSTFYATCDAASNVSRWKLFKLPSFVLYSSVHLLPLQLLLTPRTDFRLPSRSSSWL
jgi:hypothetical protein